MSNEEAVSFVAADTGDRSTVAERLKERVLAMEAAAQEVSVSFLKDLPPGSPGRRQWHDDITGKYGRQTMQDGARLASGRLMDGPGYLDSRLGNVHKHHALPYLTAICFIFSHDAVLVIFLNAGQASSSKSGGLLQNIMGSSSSSSTTPTGGSGGGKKGWLW